MQRTSVETRAFQQRLERHHFEDTLMCGFESNGCYDARIQRSFPRPDADTPAIARLQAGEAELGPRGNQIVSDGGLMPQELIVYKDADGMFANIVRTCIALPVSIKTSQRICTAGLQDAAQNVLHHPYQRTLPACRTLWRGHETASTPAARGLWADAVSLRKDTSLSQAFLNLLNANC